MAIALLIVILVAIAAFSFASQAEDKRALEVKRGWRIIAEFDGLYYEETDKKNIIRVRFPREDIEPGNYYYRTPEDIDWISAQIVLSERKEQIISRVRSEYKKIHIEMKTEPNKSLEPTRVLVTDPAAQAPRQAPVRLI